MLVSQLYNHEHKLSDTSLKVRIVYILPVFILVLLSQSVAFNGVVTFVYLALSCYVTSISLKQLFHLFKIPGFFILTGCLTVAISLHSQQPFLIYKGFSIGFTSEGVQMASITIARSVAILSVVYFGLLTHSISEISEMMHRCRVPKIFIELFVITYKFIQNLIDSAQQLYIAQQCRLAYQKNKIKSFSLLGYAIFRTAIERTYHLQNAMDSRSINDNYDFVREVCLFRMRDLKVPVIILCLLIILFLTVLYYGW